MRKPKPRKHQGWYVTDAGGVRTKLCPIESGLTVAKRALAELLRKQEQERRRNIEAGIRPDSSFLFEELAAELLEWTELNRPKSLRTYKFYLKRLVKTFGKCYVHRMDLPQWTKFAAECKAEGMSNTAINHYLVSAKRVFNLAIENTRIVRNPWRNAKCLPTHGRKRVVTDEEFQLLLDACKTLQRYKSSKEENVETISDALKTLRYTGLRPGELRNLRWDHLKLEHELIVIPASEHKTGGTASHPKDRIVPLLGEAVEIFERRKKKYGHQPLVFPNCLGKSWTINSFSALLQRIRKRAGLDEPDKNGERIVPYSLRHTRLTEAGTVEGWDIFNLMALAGHTNVTMTQRYVHTQAETLREAAKKGQERRLNQTTSPQDPETDPK